MQQLVEGRGAEGVVERGAAALGVAPLGRARAARRLPQRLQAHRAARAAALTTQVAMVTYTTI